MKLIIFYLWLQVKKSFHVIRKSFFSLICVAGAVGIGACLLSVLFQNQTTFDKVRIGIVITDNSEDSKKLFQLVYAMESVNSICNFVYLEEEDMIKELQCGTVKAVLKISSDFYNDVNTGVNTPVQLFLNKEEQFETTIFHELIMNACSLIQITEAAIYSAGDVMAVYEADISISQMEDIFTQLYVTDILQRHDTFEQRVLSATGNLDLVQYYYVAMICIILLMFGLNFGFLYQKEEIEIFRILKREGISFYQFSFVKTIAIALQLWIFMVIWYSISCLVCYVIQNSVLYWDVKVLALLGIIAFSVASYFNVVYSWCSEFTKSGMILFVFNVAMFLVSGVILPVSYMPAIVEQMQMWSPLTVWWDCISKSIFGDMQPIQYFELVSMTVFFEIMGVWGICKRS